MNIYEVNLNMSKKTIIITITKAIAELAGIILLIGLIVYLVKSENGILAKALKAKEETEVQGYYEKIEMIRTELRLNNPEFEPPTLMQMKEEFDTNQANWVARTEMKGPDQVDEEVETLELQTKEGYIFHINANGTIYKGKGEIKDTSDLKKEDALKLEIVGDGKNGGKLVKITDMSGKDYYEIEYQIDSTEGKWTKIKSGETVEVGPSQTIHARLTFGSNKGKIVSLSIEATAPQIVVKEEIDTSN